MDDEKQKRSVTVEGDTIRDCLASAQEIMNLPGKYLSYRVLVKGQSGFLGIGYKKYKLEVYEDAEKASEWVDSAVSDAMAIARARPGYFHIEYKDGFAVLKVFPPGAEGTAVRVEEIEARMKIYRIPAVPRTVIVEAIREANGEEVFLGAWTEGAKVNASIKIDISRDFMSAQAVLFPPRRGGNDLTAEEIVVQVQKHKIVHGIIYENIKLMADNKEYEIPVLVAKGTEPIPGHNGEVKYHFDITPEIEFEEDEHGRVDFRELDLIQNCTQNQLLAEKTRPTAGEDGKDILGRTIRAPQGKDVELAAGKNAHSSPDGSKLMADIDGQVILSNDNTVSVEKVYTIDNVDYQTGNINFVGSVIIHNRIEDGFSVKATGNILVYKSVGKVIIESDNDVILKGGLLGRDEGYVRAGGNIYARFVENAHLFSRKDIHVQELIMHSRVVTEGSVILTGRRAALIGGKTVAGHSIIIKELGAVSEVTTHVEIGAPPKYLSELEAIALKLDDLDKKIKEAEMALNKLQKLQKSGIRVTTKQVDTTEKLALVINTLEHEKATLAATEESLLRNFEPFPDAIVKVKNKAYKGVRINIGQMRKVLDRDSSFVSFKLDRGSIKEGIY